VIAAAFSIGVIAAMQIDSPGKGAMHRATGTFEVKISPLPLEDQAAGTDLGRMALAKQFHGDLEGTSKGEMLSAGSPAKGSAGYVAMERVSGRLSGRSGSFVLQHSATMHRGEQHLDIAVVPGSGMDELAGIAGRMNIVIEGSKHSYEFEYTLEPAR
jgi:Protein of unknown function (DUF3224)